MRHGAGLQFGAERHQVQRQRPDEMELKQALIERCR